MYRITSTKLFLSSCLLITFGNLGLAAEEDISNDYREYLRQLGVVSFHADYSSEKIGQPQSKVSHDEDWRINFNIRSLRKKVSTLKYPDAYSELLIFRNKIYSLSVDKKTATATSFSSWIDPPGNYWEQIGGFGETGLIFGYIWNGSGYFNVEQLIAGGNVEKVGSQLLVTNHQNEISILMKFDSDKGFCPTHIEFVEETNSFAGSNSGAISRIKYEVLEFQRIKGIWVPKSFSVETNLPQRIVTLPDGFAIKDGIIISGVSEADQKNQTLNIPASNILTVISISDFEFLDADEVEFELASNVPKDMPVSMQDAIHLPHKWDGTKVVPNVDEQFRSRAGDQEFMTDHSPNASGISSMWIFVVPFVVVFVLSLLLRNRQHKTS